MSTDAVTQAQSQETFDVLSFIEGTAYPVETVTIYTDALSADQLLKANQERLELDDRPEAIDYTDIDSRIEELTEKVKKSALKFSLRGLPPGLVQEIYNISEDASDSEARAAENKLIASTIVSVENATGAKDSRLWDEDAVEAFRKYLKEGEFAKVVKSVVNVNFNAAVFDQATDAGFLSRGSDVA